MKTIVFIGDAVGAVHNCIAIAQRCKKKGYKTLFIAESSFRTLIEKYEFDAYFIELGASTNTIMPAESWATYIKSNLNNLKYSAIDQLDTYLVPLFKTMVQRVITINPKIESVLSQINPDLICLDDIMFYPAIEKAKCPWVRIISCNELEIPDSDIPPRFSGYTIQEKSLWMTFRKKMEKAISPVHAQFNNFMKNNGVPCLPLGEFIAPSPYLNLFIYPKIIAYQRSNSLGSTYHYLNGCIREELSYALPRFKNADNTPLIYISYGSMGYSDVGLIRKQLTALANRPFRVICNVGPYKNLYKNRAPNIYLEDFPQQISIIQQSDLVIHHGGNNTFNETLYYARPSIILPMVLDQHDNAARADELGIGSCLDRYNHTADEFIQSIEQVLTNKPMHNKLSKIGRIMQKDSGAVQAAKLIEELL